MKYKNLFAWTLVCGFLSGFSPVAQNHVAVGNRYFSHSQYEKSAIEFEKALTKDPKNKTALTMAGWSYFKGGRYDLAQIKFGALWQMDNKSEDGLEGLGWTYFKTGQFQYALSTFEALQKVNKDHLGAVEGIAYTKFKLGDYPAAKKALAVALLYNPTSVDTHTILGYIALSEANYKDAVSHFRSADQLSKRSDPDLLTALGNAYLGVKKPECARCYFKKALRVNPNHPGALAGMAQVPQKNLKKHW